LQHRSCNCSHTGHENSARCRGGEKRKAGGSLIEASATGTLKPWREIVTPHADVASGRYQQAEFAADLWQVHLGEGSDEYKKPQEFFRRTYLTESLKRLLVGGVQRISGKGGDPVVQLQTNFGGGKPHSMLALYHLFSGVNASELASVDGVLATAGVKSLPKAACVVLVGNKISPGNPVTKSDGTVVRTLWGELAYQLGYAAGGAKEAKKAFARVKADDERATKARRATAWRDRRQVNALRTSLRMDVRNGMYGDLPSWRQMLDDLTAESARPADFYDGMLSGLRRKNVERLKSRQFHSER